MKTKFKIRPLGFSILAISISVFHTACRKEKQESGNLVPKFQLNSGSLGFKKQGTIQLRDGNFLFGIYDATGYSGLLKTDVNGKEIWRKDLSMFPAGTYPALTEENNGNIFAAGSPTSYSLLVAKFDKDGQFAWSKEYGTTPEVAFLEHIRTSSDGDLILCITHYYDPGVNSTHVIKASAANGDVIWSKEHFVPYSNQIQDIIETRNGDFMVLGHTNTFDTAVYLMRLKADGDLRVLIPFNSVENRFYSIVETENSDFAICGYTQQAFVTDVAFMLVKMESIDKIESFEITNLGFSDKSELGYQVKQCSDKGFIFVGYGFETSGNTQDVVVIKTDANGRKLWYRMFGGSATNEYATDLFFRGDEVILTGSRWDAVNPQDQNIFLVRMNQDGYFN